MTFYCTEDEIKRAFRKHSIEFVEMLKFYRDNCDKKTRDKVFRGQRKSLMEMINGDHILMICHEEKEKQDEQ
jgi:hypothetical protein